MKNFKFFVIIYALLISFALPSVAVKPDPQTCEELRMEKYPTATYNFGQKRVDDEIASLRAKHHLTLAHAKGLVGENLTRELFEKMGYLSIATVFEKKGCKVSDLLRDGSNHGIDDIFVKTTSSGWIDQTHHPVFNEAKFRKNGQIRVTDLDVTQHCKQTTFTWLGHHVHLSKNRVGARVCMSTHEVDVYASCSSCKAKTLESLSWLKTQLAERKVVRTVSVIGDKGIMKIFKVVTQ